MSESKTRRLATASTSPTRAMRGTKVEPTEITRRGMLVTGWARSNRPTALNPRRRIETAVAAARSLSVAAT